MAVSGRETIVGEINEKKSEASKEGVQNGTSQGRTDEKNGRKRSRKAVACSFSAAARLGEWRGCEGRGKTVRESGLEFPWEKRKKTCFDVPHNLIKK